jgi:hypothetical protein
MTEQDSQRITDLKKQADFGRMKRPARKIPGRAAADFGASRHQNTLATVYEKTIDVILEVTDFFSGAIHILEPGGKFVYLVASKGIPDQYLRVDGWHCLSEDCLSCRHAFYLNRKGA